MSLGVCDCVHLNPEMAASTELFKDNTLLLEFILEMCVCGGGGGDLATHIGEFFLVLPI